MHKFVQHFHLYNILPNHLCFYTVLCSTVHKLSFQINLHHLWQFHKFVSYVTVSLDLYFYTLLCTSHLFISLYNIFSTCTSLCSTSSCIITYRIICVSIVWHLYTSHLSISIYVFFCAYRSLCSTSICIIPYRIICISTLMSSTCIQATFPLQFTSFSVCNHTFIT